MSFSSREPTGVSPSYSPIAICGMGMRLPGAISNAAALWEFLVNGGDARSEVPADRWDARSFQTNGPSSGTTMSRHGYFLGDRDLALFDKDAFPSVSRKEAEQLDPQQRVLMEVVRECFESSGEVRWQGRNIGCFVGSFSDDYLDLQAKDPLYTGFYKLTGALDFAVANRISYQYDLRGPSVTVRTACSASLTALHQACGALQRREIDSALVCGVNLMTSPTPSIALNNQGVLSPDGSCKTFDASANGYARGEAITAILIKRLDDAQDQGSPVRAVIRATSLNYDGKGSSLGAPNPLAHEALIRQAYKSAGIDDFSKTAFVECHGTGTRAGDPLELRAVGNVFGEAGVYVGSVKPNLGHSEGASGLTSLIKAVLALEHRTIPPNIKFMNPNPDIDFRSGRIKVPTCPVRWPQGREARISVNSFGFGGSNAHVIIDSAEPSCVTTKLKNGQANSSTTSFTNGVVNGVPNGLANNSANDLTNGVLTTLSNGVSETLSHGVSDILSNRVSTGMPNGVSNRVFDGVSNGSTNGLTNGFTNSLANSSVSYGDFGEVLQPPCPQLLVFSASHEKSLSRSIKQYDRYLLRTPSLLPHLAYTLSARREHMAHRAYCVTVGTQPLAVSRPAKMSKNIPELVFVFTGQGAQWPQMGAQLLGDFPVVRESFEKMEQALAALPTPCPFNLREELLKPETQSLIQSATYSQPLCTALQCALVDLLHSLGVRASAVVGHSSGEIGAAYASGALSLQDAIIVAYNRGICSSAIKRSGAMGAIGLGKEEVRPFLRPGVVIGCENSPESVTVSGDVEAVDAVIDEVKASRPETLARRLRVDKAYHSHHVGDVAEEHWNAISGIKSSDPVVPFFSSLYAKEVRDGSALSHTYWRSNGENAVLFYPAVAALVKSNPQPKMFLEIGPHGALAGPLRQIMKTMDIPFQYASTQQRKSHATLSFLDSLGNLYLKGIPLDFAALHHDRKVLTDLPTYPWHYSKTSRFWTEPRLSKEWRLQRHAHHDLLGSRVTTTSELEPSWRNLLSTDSVPWIRDHVVQGNIVFPFVGFVSIAAAAAQQVAEPQEVVSLRHVNVRQALVMYGGRDVELSTTLRRVRLTDTLDSCWWEFSVSSYSQDSETWIPHCTGEIQVSSSMAGILVPTTSTSLSRSVDSNYWYKIMARAGLSYGPEFRGLGKITTDPSSNRASCSVSRIERLHEPPYQIHPCELDKCLQSIFLAMTRGLGRNFPSALVPVTIDEITLGKQTGALHLDTSAQLEAGRGDVLGAITGYDEQGSAVFQIKGLRASVLPAVGDEQHDNTPEGARVRWMPDIRFLDLSKLIRPLPDRRDQMIQLETLSLLHIVDRAMNLNRSQSPSGYLAKHFNWLLKQHEAIKNGHSVVVPDCQKLVELGEKDRQWSILSLQKILSETDVAAPAAAITRAFEIVQDVFDGNAGAVESLFQDDTLANLYRFMDFGYCRDFFRCLAHARPTMRVLEIGAGTGGATREVLNNMLTPTGEPMYSSYTFTDISAGFFATAKETLQGKYPGIKYQVLDISQDPVSQGFGESEYDLVIAANVLHATPSLQETLSNVKRLLKPDGYVFLQEVSLQSTWISSIFGLLEGWWLGEADGRADQPYINVDRWNRELQTAGFRGTEVAAYDHEPPYQVNVCLVSSPSPLGPKPSKELTVLSYDLGATTYTTTAQLFTSQGYQVRPCKFGEQQPSSDLVVSLLDLEEPAFHQMTSERLQSLQSFFRQCQFKHIIWTTNSAQVNCQEPQDAMTIGAIRTLRGELGLPITTVELENTSDKALLSLLQVLEAQQEQPPTRSTAFALDTDYEYSYSNGLVMIPRIVPFSITDQLLNSGPLEHKSSARRIELQASDGGIDSLCWVATPPKPYGDFEVEIEIDCIGLNFKDMLVAVSLVRDAKSELGLDGAGIIRNVGPKVTRVMPGDRVMFYSGGAFTSRITILQELCIRIPERLALKDAATMPCVFATAIHSIFDLGALQKGQSVLIHSACGAVGLAALQLCRLTGATIYATVGTPEKVQYLQDKFGIPRDMIFSSRDVSFEAGVMRATNGRGVDLVLDSLSGELLNASWRCVAKFGRMVEIGKRDFQGHAKLQMSVFESNRSFFGVDLHEIAGEAPHILSRLLEKTVALYEQGSIEPITPVAPYDASEVQAAFRHIQQGKHIGKIVVRMTAAQVQQNALPTKRQPGTLKLDPNSAYLLVGGMGGLGRAVSSWLVEHGARHLIFMSRSAGQGETDKTFANELSSQGCALQMFSGSVVSLDDVSRVVKEAIAPIKGVINLSMVLRDQPFVEMTQEDWDAVVLPKVQGTYNLHQALQNVPLDFFVLFGSFCGMIGQWSQANYAAANTYLDAFVQYRHRLGLPASVMDIGVVEDHGYVSRSAELTAIFKTWGAGTIQEQVLLDALQLSIQQSAPSRATDVSAGERSLLESTVFEAPSQLMVGLKTSRPLSDPSTRVRWRRDARMAIYHNDGGRDQEKGKGKEDDRTLGSLLESVAGDPAILEEPQNLATLTQAIGLKIYDLMLLPPEDLDTSASLTAIGVDSLIVMEILSWWKMTFKFSVGTLEFLNCATIDGVGRLAASRFLKGLK